jgi:acetyl esterase/lipase
VKDLPDLQVSVSLAGVVTRTTWRRMGFVAVIALAGACTTAHHRTNATPSVSDVRVNAIGYSVPPNLPAARPGTLIATRDASAQARALGAARAWQVLYHSTDLANRDIAVSGLVLEPRGKKPATGWPVVAWAHGTSGLADKCAPSLAPGLAHDPTAVDEVRSLLAHGWAVVASDYPGLGTPGTHTYLIGEADARAVVDNVSAAHELLGGQIAQPWVVVGHSEGGQTALFVAQIATRRAPEWKFLGTVALAPASTLDALIPLAEATHDPVTQAYLIYALEGLSTVDAHLDVARLLTRQAQAVLPDTRSGCIDDITNDLRRRHIDHLLAAEPAMITALNAQLGRYDNPDHVRAGEPVFIAQGTADQDVPAPATDGLAKRLCGLGDHIEYRRYPGLDHGQVVAGSRSDVSAWIVQRETNGPTTTNCAG